MFMYYSRDIKCHVIVSTPPRTAYYLLYLELNAAKGEILKQCGVVKNRTMAGLSR